jgi:hypothetical protein
VPDPVCVIRFVEVRNAKKFAEDFALRRGRYWRLHTAGRYRVRRSRSGWLLARGGANVTMQQNIATSEISKRRAKPAWTGTWHLWRVIIPRRSITGKLLHGNVLRRHNGRHWIYKRYVELDPPT